LCLTLEFYASREALRERYSTPFAMSLFSILNYVYQYIQTLTFEGITEELQKRVHLEKLKTNEL